MRRAAGANTKRRAALILVPFVLMFGVLALAQFAFVVIITIVLIAAGSHNKRNKINGKQYVKCLFQR